MNNKEVYQQICEQHDIPLFAKHWWLDIICKDWDVAIANNGNKVSGTWAYPVERKLSMTMSRTPPLTPYLGPTVVFPGDMKKSKYDNFEHEVIDSLLAQLPAFKVWETAATPGLKQAGIFRNKSYDVSVRQTFLIDLQEHEEATMLANMHEDSRRNITKAEKEISIADEPQAITELYNFQKATLDRKEVMIPYSLEEIQSLYKACKLRGCTALWVARKEEEIQAILWNMWDKTRSYYLVGAKNPAVKDKRAMTALIWHAVKHCKNLGKATFDFEGSMIPGVERFFRTFGTRRELYLVISKNKSLRWKLVRMLR